MTTRRHLVLAAAAAAALAALTGCAGSNAPPTRWYVLRDDPPPGASATMPDPAAQVWELAPGLRLPGGLDRDTLQVAAGAAGLEPLAGHRWAEPLRDSVPRLLLHDLQSLRGADRVWPAPAPAGVAVARRLRVDLLALLPDAGRNHVRVRAQWWLLDTAPDATPPRPGSADIEVPVAGASVDDLAAAHRLALWRLAERIAATP